MATFSYFEIDELKRATKGATFDKSLAIFNKNHLVTLVEIYYSK